MEILNIRQLPKNATVFEAKGCPKCHYRGYDGRTVVSELLLIDDHIRPLILKKADAAHIKNMAIKQGMSTLRDDALYKVFKGIISVEEIMRVINEEERDQKEGA